MTHEEINETRTTNKMTPEQQRIAIAEVCGLFRIMPLRRTTRKGAPDQNGVKLWYCNEHHGGAASYVEVPDYLNDLNAMHEAEKFLSRGEHYNQTGEFGLYVKNLDLVRCGRLHLIEATAAERAEAFLRTISKWEETKL